jgi:hypothetical protein
VRRSLGLVVVALVVAVAATGAIARGDTGGGSGDCSAQSTKTDAWKAEHCKSEDSGGSTSSGQTTSGTTQAAASSHAAFGALDCNGFSRIQRPLKQMGVCTDFVGYDRKRGFDNGHYVGHDEPTIQFNSTAPGSGNNVQWTMTLPHESPLPATQSFQNEVAYWFSMALCDPGSYPQKPCTPNSDSNNPNEAGSAFLEMQFYPPGFSPFISAISCDTTHWCASLHINSLECTNGFEFCNFDCIEPTNFAWIQRNGVPTGPAGPDNATNATYTPNEDTLLMNQGDKLVITIHDSEHGVMTSIDDLTTGQSGFMVASGANGFQTLNLNNCEGSPLDFHPEFSTAKVGNYVPWAALQANVGFAAEIGHFENGLTGDNDDDDAPCFRDEPGVRLLSGCLALAQGGDIDFDGPSYKEDWPNGSPSAAQPIMVGAPLAGGTGRYSQMQFETDVAASEFTCRDSGVGCTALPPGAAFYPFYSTTSDGCTWMFGNDVAGLTTSDYGKVGQYGQPNLPWFFGDLSGGIRDNPC